MLRRRPQAAVGSPGLPPAALVTLSSASRPSPRTPLPTPDMSNARPSGASGRTPESIGLPATFPVDQTLSGLLDDLAGGHRTDALAELFQTVRANYPAFTASAERDPLVVERLTRLVVLQAMTDLMQQNVSELAGLAASPSWQAGTGDRRIDELMYEDATRPHAAAQAEAEEVFPRTITRFCDVLQGITTGLAPWRPRGCATADLLTNEHIACRDPDLHDAAARISLATCLASLIDSAGARCGLELFDQAWAIADPRTRPDWRALAARIQARLVTMPLADLSAAVAHAVETRTWGSDPLVSAIAHAIAEDVARLPALQVTAVLVAALKRTPPTESCQ